MDITALAALRAMDGLMQRQTVTANNIANAGSREFSPGGVVFEAALRSALASGDPQSVRTSAIESRVLQESKVPASVRLDQEVATLSETTLNYQLLAGLLERKLAMSKLAYSDGRGA